MNRMITLLALVAAIVADESTTPAAKSDIPTETPAPASPVKRSLALAVHKIDAFGAVPDCDPAPVPVPFAPVHVQPAFNTITLQKNVPVFVPQPIEVPVEKKVPVYVRVPIDKPYPVPVPHPYPVPVAKPYPVAVERPYPVTVERHVPVPVNRLVPYPVIQPVHVPVTRYVPYAVPKPIVLRKPVPVPVAPFHHHPLSLKKKLLFKHFHPSSAVGVYGYGNGALEYSV